MRVRATRFGFYLQKRKPGEEFEFSGKPSHKWMEPVDEAARRAFAPEAAPSDQPTGGAVAGPLVASTKERRPRK